ncbi:MAG: hypothetical protein J7485_06340 [Sphingobium sp.]|nr:hypothetical protein [Sphingobium sp.]
MAIAIRRAQEGRPIQIRADILGRTDAIAPFLDRLGAASMTDDAADQGATSDKPAEAGWRDEDLSRAIAVAEEAGLASYRIEIAPDGTITIYVGGPSQGGE